jgi:NADPH-dependent glutamate synthase beta subunit-like oxidoreductase
VSDETPQHAVAVIGGATAGAEAAGLLAGAGITVVVFEQNPRPYGKIEDGLPRWHTKLRRKEYDTINAKLTRPGVHYVPLTKVGRDVDFRELVAEWGFSAVVLAHGAWRDRPLAVEGVDRFVGKGLVYQNDFIHWFNNSVERSYAGVQYDVPDGAIVVGGGLASIDVVKVLQIEAVRRVLAEQGIDEDMHRLEVAGIPAVLDEHGLSWERLGLEGATLYYRRRIEDMPLAEMPAEADEERRRKVQLTRRRILEKAMAKYCFDVQPLRVPVAPLSDGDRLAGLRFQHTRVEQGAAVPVEGRFEDVPAPLVVSSIGSVPEPMAGVAQRGLLYDYLDPELGRLDGYDSVFSTGNVVTGKGNIIASRRHSVQVTSHVIRDFLGVRNGSGPGHELVEHVRGQAPLAADRVSALLSRVRARQDAVGFDGDYAAWLEQVTPPDMV